MFEATHFSIILFTTTLINCYATYVSWSRRNTRGGYLLAWGISLITVWTLASGLDYAAVAIPTKIFFAKIEAFSYNYALVLFTLFSFSYAGNHAVLKNLWLKASFFLIATFNILLTWTNEFHHLIWQDFTHTQNSQNIVVFHHGPGFTWITILGYIMVALMVFNLWVASRRGSILSRRQARLLFLALLVPIISNVFYLVAVKETYGIDWTSITFSISGLLILAALYGPRFLDIVPIARYTMIEWMSDGVLVLDSKNHLVDFNPAAGKLYNLVPAHLGAPIESCLVEWPEITRLIGESDQNARSGVLHHKDRHIIEARLTELTDDRNQVYGRLLVFRNITSRYQIESALSERVKELRSILDLTLLLEQQQLSLSQVLQNSLTLITNAMQYPERAYARLVIDNQSFCTPNYQETPNRLLHDFSIGNQKTALLEVGYLDNGQETGFSHFLEEEKNLIYIMSERLGTRIGSMKSEIALQENERLLRTIAANYPNSYLSIIEKDFSVGLSAGQEFTKQNLNPDDFIGLNLDAVFGEQTEKVREYYQKTFAGEEQTFYLLINNQHQRYRTVPLYNQDGSIERILSVAENITDQVAAQKALQESEERYRTVANYTFHWEYWRGPEGDILYMSPSCERITGYTPNEFIQDPDLIESIIAPEDHHLMEDHHAHVREEYIRERLHQVEFRIRCKNGETRWIAHTCQAIVNDNGLNMGIRATNRDITAQKQIEIELRQAEKQLFEQERTMAAFEERQRLARDLHDSVNQSIHSTVLFAETLNTVLEKNNPQRAKQIANRMSESARQAIKEVRLLLYELQSHENKPDDDLIENLEYRLNSVEQRAGVQTNVSVDGALTEVAAAIQQEVFWIVIEALNNALKHAQARRVNVQLVFKAGQISGQISDNGIGFDPNTLAKGGLGLQNMKARAESFGAKLQIDSATGTGTQVRFTTEKEI